MIPIRLPAWPRTVPEWSRILLSSWFMAMVLSVSGLVEYTRNNEFPLYVHPDESGKVKQLLKNKRNYNHPLMLLTVSRWIHKVQGRKPSGAAVVRAGRTASALFGTGAVVALALLARRLGRQSGVPAAEVCAGWAAGIFGLMSPLMYELTHYMKEDPSFALGTALVLLTTHVHWERRDLTSLLFVGAAMGTAASGKYLGWLLLPFALGVVIACPTPKWTLLRRTGIFLGSLALVWAILNYSVFKNPAALFVSLNRETEGVVGGHRGLTKKVPHADYFHILMRIPHPVLILFGAFVAGLVRRRSTTVVEWFIVAFPVALVGLMSFSPKVSSRYFLPVDMLIYFGAGVGAVWAALWLAPYLRRGMNQGFAVVLAMLAVTVVFSLRPGLTRTMKGFARDDREQLKAWITQTLPTSAKIAQDDRVNLATTDRWEYDGEPILAQAIVREEFIADLGTVPELRALGVTHIIVATPTFIRFEHLTPLPQVAEQFALRKRFYQSLGAVKGGEPLPGVEKVWEARSGINTYLQPGLHVYDVSAVPPAGLAQGS